MDNETSNVRYFLLYDTDTSNLYKIRSVAVLVVMNQSINTYVGVKLFYVFHFKTPSTATIIKHR
jgi:hypothetical protein